MSVVSINTSEQRIIETNMLMQDKSFSHTNDEKTKKILEITDCGHPGNC